MFFRFLDENERGFPPVAVVLVMGLQMFQMSACVPAGTSVGGVGGATGSGGNASSGGASGTGGVTGSGGIAGSNGQPGSGGTTATGGGSATGGQVGTGGGPRTGGASGTGGTPGTGGGGPGTGGRIGSGGASGTGGGAPASGGTPGTGGAGGGSADPALAKFSFFVVSLPSIVALSGKAAGFGGDLRFGKPDGLSGADEICRLTAERGLAGAGQKQWRAFLSVRAGPGGAVVNARDRIGPGPWNDRLGRLVSNDLAGLFAGDRPAGAAVVVNDLPNENGHPNHYVGPGGLGATVVDNHDTLTGSDKMGGLLAASATDTCNDWTSTMVAGRPWIGHSWPRNPTSGRNWVSDHTAPGCAAGIDVTLGGTGTGNCVGCGGGYGGFFCFALP